MRLCLSVLGLALLAAPAVAAEPALGPPADPAAASGEVLSEAIIQAARVAEEEADESQQFPALLESTRSVQGDLADDARPASTLTSSTPQVSPWQAWKNRIRDKTGITFGGSYGVLWQHYSQSRFGEEDSVGSKFTFNASLDLTRKGKPNALKFDIAVEDRRALGTEFPPLFAGVLAGSGLPTAATWGRFDLGVTQAYVHQTLAEGRFQWTVGKVFAPNFVDAYPFFDDNRQFLNLVFSTSPTIAVPLRGFGLVGAAFPGSGSLYVKGGVFTANSDDTGITIDDFFTRNERFFFVEIGQTGFARRNVPIYARGPMDRNNIHMTLWYRNALTTLPDGNPLLRPRPEAYGVAFNINQMTGDNLMWFLRGGIGTGGFASANAVGGLGYRPATRTADLFGIGVGWSQPDVPDIAVPLPPFRDLPSQVTGEIFYRLALTRFLAITPDVQVIINPSLAPDRSSLTVFSMRARLSF